MIYCPRFRDLPFLWDGVDGQLRIDLPASIWRPRSRCQNFRWPINRGRFRDAPYSRTTECSLRTGCATPAVRFLSRISAEKKKAPRPFFPGRFLRASDPAANANDSARDPRSNQVTYPTNTETRNARKVRTTTMGLAPSLRLTSIVFALLLLRALIHFGGCGIWRWFAAGF